jgi:hypothetical protein
VFATLWLDFKPGSNGTVNVPTRDYQGNYSLAFGPATGIQYSVNVSQSAGRLGLNSHPGSTMIVNGNGAAGANDADVVFGYYFENNTAPVSVSGLTVGLDISRRFTDQGRNLQLSHVNINPFAWQVYVSNSNGYPVAITNSLINEVGVFPYGVANISNSVLQLAVTAAMGPGAKLNISGTRIWSQAIQAANGGLLTIGNSQLYGNFVSAAGTGSKITMTSVGANRNGDSSQQTCAPVNGFPPNDNGVPLCTPFNPLHQCVQIVPPSGGGVISASPSLTCPSM